ncbi:MAG: hypothetical protein JNN25_08085 [Candidatus Kapabacteria bacterium]|nr:hypothetical protein [Candidatus Kapabacteria bacterium]
MRIPEDRRTRTVVFEQPILLAVRTIGAGKEEKREEEDAAEQHIRNIADVFC